MYHLGIDLGTTFTGAAIVRGGAAPEMVGLGDRSMVVPSVLFAREDGTFLVGVAAERRGMTEYLRVAREFKRRMGDTTPILLDGVPWSPQALTAELLRWVLDTVTERQGGPPERVAVSHPANWGPFKTDLLGQAVELAGIEAATLISEPEAAALHWASQERVAPGTKVIVYDLGGGTFDIAILEKTETGFRFLGEPSGIEQLGGLDFDAAVFDHVRRQHAEAFADLDSDDPAVRPSAERLRADCTAAKEALSSDTTAVIPLLLPGISGEVWLTRVEFEATVRPAIGQTLEALRRAMKRSGVEPAEIDATLLVGGSSRVPLVAQMVSAELGRPVVVDAHPKHAVALGAARALDLAPSGLDLSGTPEEIVEHAGTVVTGSEQTDETPLTVSQAASRSADTGASDVAPAPPAPPSPTLPAAPEPPVIAAPPEPPAPPTQPRKGDTRGLIIAAVALVVVLVAAFALIRWLSGPSDPDGFALAAETSEFMASSEGGEAAEAALGTAREQFGASAANPVPAPLPGFVCSDPVIVARLDASRAALDTALAGSPDGELTRRFERTHLVYDEYLDECTAAGDELPAYEAGVPNQFENAQVFLDARIDEIGACTNAGFDSPECNTYVAAADLDLTVVPIDGRPSAPIEAEGAIWTPVRSGGEGFLVRVDRSSTETDEAIPLGIDGAESPVHLDDDIWVIPATSTTDIAILDLDSGETVITRAGAGNATPRVTDEHVWVANRDDKSVTRIARSDPSDTFDYPIGTDLSDRGMDLVTVGDEAWATLRSEGELWHLTVDAEPERFELAGDGGGIIEAFGSLWVALPDSVERFDLTAGEDIGRVTIGVGGSPSRPFATDDAVWVANQSDGTLMRIDPGTNEVTATLEVPGRPIRGVHAGSAIWVVARDTATLTRVELGDDPTVTWTVPLSTGLLPDQALVVGDDVWVAIKDADQLVRVSD